MGSSQATSPRRVGSGGSTRGTSHSFAGRRAAARRALRHRFVAMRYSQVRSDERPSNDAMPCHAASRVSCSASSASLIEPSMR